MKKILVVLLSVVLAVSMFAACGSAATEEKTEKAGSEQTEQTTTAEDLKYIQEKGTLIVGITDFEPMDYREGGEWIGFDADLARAFGEYLGVDVEFTEIEWESKTLELGNKNIDCVWNGMTLTDEVKNSMACSKAYCNNAQVVVVSKDIADSIKTVNDCTNLNFAVEEGSAGEDMADENKFNYTAVANQATALLEVASGTCDAAIIDSLMAAAMVGEGTGYADLTYTISLNSEEYGVGFRADSDMPAKLNEFLDKCIADGTIDEIAAKYGVQAALIK